MRSMLLTILFLFLISSAASFADEPSTKEAIRRVVQSAGGEDKLLKLFRIRERLNVSSDPEKKASERESILEPPKYWWLGTRERVKEDKEPATFLVWAWTLGALTDPDSKVTELPEISDGEQTLFGLQVSETITPAMDIYFNKSDNRLARIDWRSDIHRFSQWKEYDGTHYPAKCVGYKKSTGKPWYFSEIISLERLNELPKNLSR